MLGLDGPRDRAVTRRGVLTALGALGVGAAGLTGVAACTKDKSTWNGPGGGGNGGSGKAKVSITEPADGAENVPAGTEIVFTTTEGLSPEVTLKDEKGADVPGAMHPDGAGWLPKAALDYSVTYTATVTVKGDDGKTIAATSKFTTMAKTDKSCRW